jgi:REP-associated tyrosine transposase
MTDWPHSPIHRFTAGGAYMVTGGTYLKVQHFAGAQRLKFLCDALLRIAAWCRWNLQAWAVFPNHYHFVALTSPPSKSLPTFIRKLHAETAVEANRWDHSPGRQVWFQYWDTALTFQRSYLARLSYVHRNAVHHKIVLEPTLYPWCSAGWLQSRAATSFYKTIMKFRIERLNIPDNFQVDWLPGEAQECGLECGSEAAALVKR